MPIDSKQEKRPSVATKISYCPHLGLYHYTRVDGADYLFDTPKLEMAIDAYLKDGQSRLADFMVNLTALARLHPHQVVSLDENGQCELSDLLPEPTPADPTNKGS